VVLSSVNAIILMSFSVVNVCRQSNFIAPFVLLGIPSTFCNTNLMVSSGFFPIDVPIIGPVAPGNVPAYPCLGGV